MTNYNFTIKKNNFLKLVGCLGIMILSQSLQTGAYAFADDKTTKKARPSAFIETTEKGVRVWRGRTTKKAASTNAVPALLGGEKVIIKKEIIYKDRVIYARHTRPAKLRVVGFFSGYGKNIPYVQGFYSGYPRSKNSRSYVQGFYSGLKTNRKRRFPLERPDGRRRY